MSAHEEVARLAQTSGDLADLARYGRAMFERYVIAAAENDVMQDRLNELAAQNAALRAELGLPPAERCLVCNVPTGSSAKTCEPCRRVLASTGTEVTP